MGGTIVGIIIILVLLLVLVGIGYYAYRTVKNKIRNFSQMAFGTDSLQEGFGKVEAEYAATPKSVSGATSMYLPRIIRDFPDFHYDEMKERAENVLISYLRSIDAEDASLLTEGTKELKDQLGMQISMLRSETAREHFESPHIHRTEIYQYRKAKGRCSVVFQTAIEYFYYREKAGTLADGSRDTRTQARYNVECMYIQDRDMVENLDDASLALNCPNCGAPLSGVGARVCAYCDTPIQEFNIRSWNFSDVKLI